MPQRLGRAAALESAQKLAVAFGGIVVAGAAIAKAAGAPTGVTAAIAIVGTGGAITASVLSALHERAKARETWAALLRRSPVPVEEAARDGLFYEIGVDFEVGEALAAIRGAHEHAPYVERDLDKELRPALRDAGGGVGVALFVVSGPSKAGKSRTLLEAICRSRRS